MPSPSKTGDVNVLTVSQLTRRVKGLLEQQVGEVWVSGEISNWVVSSAGHAYFTMKDDATQLSGVMFRGSLKKAKFEPENGLEVVVRGRVTVYERRGNYQIICEEMHPRGMGALQLAFEKLKKKLDEEGLFAPEHKKELPLLPKRIGVVTSPTGAAIRDILNVINRRFANVHVLLYPAKVQGDGAAADIVAGIKALDKYGVDVMIVGRGGGSLEDLWAFNEEPVVRAVFNATTPIISAVGHEIDCTLTDFAADKRAPTPSAAAELVVKEQQALVDQLTNMRRRMGKALKAEFQGLRHRLTLAQSARVFRRPDELVMDRRQMLDELRGRIDDAVRDQHAEAQARLEKAGRGLVLLSPRNQVQRAVERLHVLDARLKQSGAAQVERTRSRVGTLGAQLDALSPLKILTRGYSVSFKMPGKALIRDAKELKRGDTVLMRFGHGEATASVEEIRKAQDGGK